MCAGLARTLVTRWGSWWLEAGKCMGADEWQVAGDQMHLPVSELGFTEAERLRPWPCWQGVASAANLSPQPEPCVHSPPHPNPTPTPTTTHPSAMSDLLEMLQSQTFLRQLGYGVLEIAAVLLFPELKPLFHSLEHGGLHAGGAAGGAGGDGAGGGSGDSSGGGGGTGPAGPQPSGTRRAVA